MLSQSERDNISIKIKYLVKAKELLEQPGGYIKGRLHDGQGGYCALGAIDQATRYNRGDLPDILARKIPNKATLPKDTYNYYPSRESSEQNFAWVARYNNMTSQEDTVNLFCSAIKDLQDQLDADEAERIG